MILIIKGHTFSFEIENICRLFLPQDKIYLNDYELYKENINDVKAVSELGKFKSHYVLRTRLRLEDWEKTAEEQVLIQGDIDKKDIERRLCVQLYKLFSELFDVTLPWGAVTGVRPVKLMRKLIEQQGVDKAAEWFKNSLLVSDDRISLCLDTLKTENRILKLSRPESFSLYISIPFCPSRCDYCSFVSHTVERAAKLIPDYVNNLCSEIEYTGKIAHKLGLRLETVYMGGGTPTTLSSDQIKRILGTIEQSFDLSHIREYTVEAGRPDTVTKEKLYAIFDAGVDRISINPQTLNDEVLKVIGRRHTSAQFIDAFLLARQCGFKNINADLIAGLPGDDYESFKNSINGLLRLSPECITIHTLAMKRASNLVKYQREDYDKGNQTVCMVNAGLLHLKAEGYHPYYLYRQSRTVGGTENTGWSKPGYEGLYNVFIMDETHTILACGAGAVTKLRQPNGDYIERIFNYKFPYEYNNRFDEMIQRKERVITFYEK